MRECSIAYNKHLFSRREQRLEGLERCRSDLRHPCEWDDIRREPPGQRATEGDPSLLSRQGTPVRIGK